MPAAARDDLDPFVGRRRELAQLEAAVDDALAGHGRMVLLSGELGIGKTRLAEEGARRASAKGMLAVWGRCWEGGGAPPYWPWIQVIRALAHSLDADSRRALFESERAALILETIAQIVPELSAAASRASRPSPPAHADPSQSQFRLLDSVASLLKEAARTEPLAILLDDLHDADSSSLRMLRFVARELMTTRVLIVGTYRDVEVQRAPELRQQVGDLSREARSISLGGLTSAEVGQFFTEMAGENAGEALAEKLHQATAGNPLFVEGIVRGLISERDQGRDIRRFESFSAPHSLREAIALRLAKLSDQARATLEVAAVIGNEFDVAICERVKETAREELNSQLDETSRHGILLAAGSGRYRFVHAVIRGYIYESLDTNLRIRLHGAIGTAIEELYANDHAAHLAELAHHFGAAGITQKTIEYSHRAAQAAYHVYAYTVAAEHWRAAMALTDGQRDLRRADILFGLGRAEALFIDPARGIPHLEEALGLYRELNSDFQVARSHVAIGVAMVFFADFAAGMNVARSLEHFRMAQEWNGEWTDRITFGWLYRGLSVALFQQLRIEEALTEARRAMEIWREASIPEWASAGAFIAQLLSIQGRYRESAPMTQEVMGAVRGQTDPALFHAATWSAGWIEMLAKNPEEARRFYTMAFARSEVSPHQREGSFEFLAFTEILLGNLARAKELAAAHRMNPSFRGVLALYDGDLDAALEARRAMIEWARAAGHLWDVVDTSAHLAHSLYIGGDSIQAFQVVEAAMKHYDPSIYLLEMVFRPSAVWLEVELGRPERALEHLEKCRKIIAEGEDWRGREGLVARAEGVLAAALGRPFKEHFETAIAIFKRYSLPFEEAEALISWGRALLSDGNRADADAKFDAAIAIHQRCGVGERYFELIEKRRTPFPRPAVDLLPSRACSTFQHQGDFWIVTHNGKTSRLRNVKGLSYIAQLLARPGERLHVIDLVQAIEGGAIEIDRDVALGQALTVKHGLGDVGETLDAKARAEYRQRQSELRAELDTAMRDNDPGRAEGARHELELLTDELTAALERGGRRRKTHAHTDRARSLVTKHLRSAIDLISRNDPQLGTHLGRSIHTGNHCAYLPAAGEKIEWQI